MSSEKEDSCNIYRRIESFRYRDDLRNELIRRTVLTAASHSDFYRNLYAAASVDLNSVQTIADLPSLPAVEKEQLRSAGKCALCRLDQTRLSHIQNTSGTTDRPFFLYRSMEERQFIRFFFQQLEATDASTRPAPIALQFVNSVHGTPTPIPSNIFVVQGSVQDDDGLERTLRLLRMTFETPGLQPRVSVIAGAANDILILTDWLIENDFPVRTEFAVRGIQPIGRYITSRWRELLRVTWDSLVMDRYSLSEVFGGATACPDCLGYHFDSFVVPEVQSLNRRETVTSGVGRLLLTALYPFVQLQPFIRYYTGDLFAVDPNACTSDVTYRFLGRENHALFEPSDPTNLLLAGVDLIDTLDACPELARDHSAVQLRGLCYTDAPGLPRARGYIYRNGDFTKFTIRAELVVPLSLFPGRLTKLGDWLEEELLRRSPSLTDLVTSGRARLCVEFTGPGTLGSLGKLTKFWACED